MRMRSLTSTTRPSVTARWRLSLDRLHDRNNRGAVEVAAWHHDAAMTDTGGGGGAGSPSTNTSACEPQGTPHTAKLPPHAASARGNPVPSASESAPAVAAPNPRVDAAQDRSSTGPCHASATSRATGSHGASALPDGAYTTTAATSSNAGDSCSCRALLRSTSPFPPASQAADPAPAPTPAPDATPAPKPSRPRLAVRVGGGTRGSTLAREVQPTARYPLALLRPELSDTSQHHATLVTRHVPVALPRHVGRGFTTRRCSTCQPCAEPFALACAEPSAPGVASGASCGEWTGCIPGDRPGDHRMSTVPTELPSPSPAEFTLGAVATSRCPRTMAQSHTARWRRSIAAYSSMTLCLLIQAESHTAARKATVCPR